MAERKNKQVDLVIYKGGERIVVGRASVEANGRIEAQIKKDLRKDIKDIVYGDLLDNISMNPKPPTVADLTYHEISTPPLKIQE